MAATSAGLLLWRETSAGLEVLIVHPGGPFWARKHEGAWSLPKGEFDPENEDGEIAAAREFAEELGTPAPPPPWVALGDTVLKSRKRIVAWAAAGDLDPASTESNTFMLQWPPKSGRMIEVPEVDEARWVSPAEAAELLNPAQVVFVQRLVESMAAAPSSELPKT